MKFFLNPQTSFTAIRIGIAIAAVALAALGISHLLVHAGISTSQGAG